MLRKIFGENIFPAVARGVEYNKAVELARPERRLKSSK